MTSAVLQYWLIFYECAEVKWDTWFVVCVYFVLLCVFLQINNVFVTVYTLNSAGSSFLFVNTSGHYGGQRAQLMLPPLKENDTHCVSFLFYRRGSTPPMLNIYIKGRIRWYWHSLVLVHTGAGTHWCWYTLVLVHTGTAPSWFCVLLFYSIKDFWQWWMYFLQRTTVSLEFQSLMHQVLPTTSGRGWS